MSRVAFLAGGRRKGLATRNRSLRLESLERRELLAASVFKIQPGATFSAKVDVGTVKDVYAITGTINTSSTVTLNPAVAPSTLEKGTFVFKGLITIKEDGITLVKNASYEIKGTASEDANPALAATAKRVTLTATDVVSPSWVEEYLKVLLGGKVTSTGTTNNTKLVPAPQTQNIVLSTLAPDSLNGYKVVDEMAKFTMKD